MTSEMVVMSVPAVKNAPAVTGVTGAMVVPDVMNVLVETGGEWCGCNGFGTTCTIGLGCLGGIGRITIG